MRRMRMSADAPPAARWPRVRVAVLVVALLAGGAESIGRGIWRAAHDSGDLLPVYVGAAVMVRGGNPYDVARVSAWWSARHASSPIDWVNTPVAYPPAVLALVSPLTMLSWPAARFWFALAGLGLTVAGVGRLAMGAGDEARDERWWWAIAGSLLCAPLHSGVAKGNVTIVAAGLSMLAVAATLRGSRAAAGLLAGLATVIKPQIGIGVLVYYLRFGRVRTIVIVLGIVAAATALGLVWLDSTQGTWAWTADWLRLVRSTMAPGAINDVSALNPYRYQLLNLEWPLLELCQRADVARAGAIATAGLLAAVLFVASRRMNGMVHDDALLFVAATWAIFMLPIYRRSYDGVLLLPAFIWCLRHCRTPALRGYAWSGLALLSVFATPGASMLTIAAAAWHLPVELTRAWVWRVVLLPHQAWAVAAIATILTLAAHARAAAAPGRLASAPSAS